MAKQRMINTKFWSDPFTQGLKPNEKLLYIYLLTNEKTSICGIYEITKRTIMFDTGLKLDSLSQAVHRLSQAGKIRTFKDWIYLTNFKKHQNSNPSICKGVQRAIKELTERVFDRLYTGWVQPGLPEPELEPELEPSDLCKTEEAFKSFWDLYPNKKNKKKALQAFQKITADFYPSILKSLRRQINSADWKKENGKYIPHPTTWLNGERWEDESGPMTREEEYFELGFNKFADKYGGMEATYYQQINK